MWLSFTKVLMCFMGMISLGIEPCNLRIENRLAVIFRDLKRPLEILCLGFFGAMKRPATKRPAARMVKNVKKKPAGKKRTDVFQNKGCAGSSPSTCDSIDSVFHLKSEGPMRNSI